MGTTAGQRTQLEGGWRSFFFFLEDMDRQRGHPSRGDREREEHKIREEGKTREER